MSVRELFVGASGSGKTHGAKQRAGELLREHRGLLVFDPTDSADSWRPAGARECYTRADYLRALREGATVIVVRAAWRDWATVPRSWRDTGRSVYLCPALAGWLVVVDEAHVYTPRQQIDESYAELVRRGRHLGLSVLSITQRGADLSPELWTNATAIHAFTLGHRADVQALREHLALPASWAPRWQPVGPPAPPTAVRPIIWRGGVLCET